MHWNIAKDTDDSYYMSKSILDVLKMVQMSIMEVKMELDFTMPFCGNSEV